MRRQPIGQAAVGALAQRPARTIAVMIARTLAVGAAALIVIDTGAPDVVRHPAASAHQHAQVLVERVQWISYGWNADYVKVAVGIVGELAGTIALIMLAIGWAEWRRRRGLQRPAVT